MNNEKLEVGLASDLNRELDVAMEQLEHFRPKVTILPKLKKALSSLGLGSYESDEETLWRYPQLVEEILDVIVSKQESIELSRALAKSIRSNDYTNMPLIEA